jgi:thiol reductant ABC exporter CydC subunit
MNRRQARHDAGQVLLRLLSQLEPFRAQIALAVLLGAGTIASSIGLMSCSAYIISAAALHPSIAVLAVAIVGVRFFGVARGIVRYLERLVSHSVTFKLLARLRTWCYAALEPLAPARLLRFQSADLYQRIVADVDTLDQFYVRAVAPPLVACVTTLLLWLLLARFDLRLATTAAGFLVLAGVGVPALTYKLSHAGGQRLIALRATLNTLVVDGLQGMAELVAFGQAGAWQERIAVTDAALRRVQFRLAVVSALGTALNMLLTALASLAVLVVAVPLVTAGHIEGVFLATLVLATQAAFEAVQGLPASVQALSTSVAAGRRLFELLDATPEVCDVAAQAAIPTSASLAVEGLRFRYGASEPWVLSDVSFRVPEGRLVAIVGPSGSGKSTLAQILLRFWEYDAGACRLGGREMRTLPQDEARQRFAVVSQQTHLFNTTIYENLRLARPEATEEEIIAAAKAAQLHHVVQCLPDGYATRIGENGHLLSGGERQRLAIARALLKDAPILLLDEPTAHLDLATERMVLRHLLDAARQRTTLLITHRLVGLEAADEILVLSDGRIVERGRHAELLAAGGLYRRLWELQEGARGFLREDDDEADAVDTCGVASA